MSYGTVSYRYRRVDESYAESERDARTQIRRESERASARARRGDDCSIHETRRLDRGASRGAHIHMGAGVARAASGEREARASEASLKF
jgi:hypothetical protein